MSRDILDYYSIFVEINPELWGFTKCTKSSLSLHEDTNLLCLKVTKLNGIKMELSLLYKPVGHGAFRQGEVEGVKQILICAA